MRLHAIVDDFRAAATAVEGGATVIQLRLKGASTEEVVEAGRPFRGLPVTFIVNDDVEAALELEADGVHLGRTDPGAERAVDTGLILGTSAASVEEARAGERVGATYVGAGPIWPTPSKPDADPPIGLDGLAEICAAVSIPVVAIVMSSMVRIARLRAQSGIGLPPEVEHRVATMVGRHVTAQATLAKVDGRKLIFDVAVKEGDTLVAEVRVERVVLDRQRFIQRALDQGAPAGD